MHNAESRQVGHQSDVRVPECIPVRILPLLLRQNRQTEGKEAFRMHENPPDTCFRSPSGCSENHFAASWRRHTDNPVNRIPIHEGDGNRRKHYAKAIPAKTLAALLPSAIGPNKPASFPQIPYDVHPKAD